MTWPRSSGTKRAKHFSSHCTHRGQWHPLTHDDYWRVSANIEMRDFGMRGPSRESILWFGLAPTAFYKDCKGRLIVYWPPPERSWWRWADRNRIAVWKAALSQWRGIYFIFDESDGKGYVGSAYGTENIVGRWLSYAAGGHGGNKELRNRDPARFRFSILVPPPGLLLYLQYASPALLAAGEVA